jgi:glutamyl-tRNA(Gln) amidotransferase subunit D
VPNLRDAIQVAAQADFAEVCIVFSADIERTKGQIIRGCRARKVHSYAINAFMSINAPPIGNIAAGQIRMAVDLVPRSNSTLTVASSLDTNVVLVKLTPSMTPAMLMQILQGASGAVIEGTGVGHIGTDLQPVITQFGKPTVISTQALEGGERLGTYEVDSSILAIGNIIRARDMNSDTALVKLMWALGQRGDVAATIQMNIAGEISSRGIK